MAEKLSELQKAALDFMIEYKKQNPEFITNWQGEQNIFANCATFVGMGMGPGCQSPAATVTPAVYQAAGPHVVQQQQAPQVVNNHAAQQEMAQAIQKAIQLVHQANDQGPQITGLIGAAETHAVFAANAANAADVAGGAAPKASGGAGSSGGGLTLEHLIAARHHFR